MYHDVPHSNILNRKIVKLFVPFDLWSFLSKWSKTDSKVTFNPSNHPTHHQTFLVSNERYGYGIDLIKKLIFSIKHMLDVIIIKFCHNHIDIFCSLKLYISWHKFSLFAVSLSFCIQLDFKECQILFFLPIKISIMSAMARLNR